MNFAAILFGFSIQLFSYSPLSPPDRTMFDLLASIQPRSKTVGSIRWIADRGVPIASIGPCDAIEGWSAVTLSKPHEVSFGEPVYLHGYGPLIDGIYPTMAHPNPKVDHQKTILIEGMVSARNGELRVQKEYPVMRIDSVGVAGSLALKRLEFEGMSALRKIDADRYRLTMLRMMESLDPTEEEGLASQILEAIAGDLTSITTEDRRLAALYTMAVKKAHTAETDLATALQGVGCQGDQLTSVIAIASGYDVEGEILAEKVAAKLDAMKEMAEIDPLELLEIQELGEVRKAREVEILTGMRPGAMLELDGIPNLREWVTAAYNEVVRLLAAASAADALLPQQLETEGDASAAADANGATGNETPSVTAPKAMRRRPIASTEG